MIIKNDEQKKDKRLQNKLIICFVLIACNLVLGTIAYLQYEYRLTNSFTIGTVSTEVEETFQNDVKSNVSIKNTGNVDAFMRAKVLVYFVDGKGNVTGEVPLEGKDYTITMGDGILTNWIFVDGCYYFTKPVAANSSSDILIKECKSIKESEVYKDGNRRLVVDIAAEAIQTSEVAISEAWTNMIVENGELKIKP